jgi:hypothetical protein
MKIGITATRRGLTDDQKDTLRRILKANGDGFQIRILND